MPDFGGCRPQLYTSYGMNTVGGRGPGGVTPKIIRVNSRLDTRAPLTLNGDGTWSGQYGSALEASGPRYVVFEVSGYIDIHSNINVVHPYLTVAGQTSPDGVVIRSVYDGTSVEAMHLVNTHDVALHHYHVAPGWDGTTSTICNSGIVVFGGNHYRCLLDHMTCMWAQDENTSARPTSLNSGQTDITFWRSFVAEGLVTAPGSGGCGGGGLSGGHGILLPEGIRRAAVLQSILASNRERNPWLQGGGSLNFTNNLLYDWSGQWGVLLGNFGLVAPWDVTAEGNRFVVGPYGASDGFNHAFFTSGSLGGSDELPGNRLYLNDNTVDQAAYPGVTVTLHHNTLSYDPTVGSPPSDAPRITGALGTYVALPSSAVEAFVVAHAGARPIARLVNLDARVITHIANRTGDTFLSQPSDVGGYPPLPTTEREFPVPSTPFAVVDAFGRNTLDRLLDDMGLDVEPGGAGEAGGGVGEYGGEAPEYEFDGPTYAGDDYPYGGDDDGAAGSFTGIDAYSDEEMACPAEWYGGYKEPWLLRAGDAEKALSDPMTGEPVPSVFRVTMWDGPQTVSPIPLGGTSGRLRAQLASPNERYWRDPLSFYMTTRANRRLLGRPFTAFVGFIADAQPTNPRGFDITLVDIITRGVLSEELEIPWRKIGDGFLHLLDAVSENLDREQAEPILYGRHTRTDPLVEPSPPAAWPVIPIYLGIETLAGPGGNQFHCWLVCGHAVTSCTIQVDGEDVEEGTAWLVATQANWLAQFGTPYVDKESGTYGNLRRYTLIYGQVGDPSDDPDDCALGDKQLTALVEGAEDVGDGSGTLLTDYYQQYKHFVINYVANRAHFSYGGPSAIDTSGLWLTSPTWALTGETVSIVDEESFDTASAIAAERFGDPLEGAVAIGFDGRSIQATQLLAQWNRDGFVRFGDTSEFRMGIVHLHPTEAVKAAAPLFSDAYECIKGTFKTDIRWPEQKHAIEFQCDYDPESGVFATKGLAANTVEATRYNRTAVLKRQYLFLPGITQCQHLAELELATLVHPPRLVAIEESVEDDEAVSADPNRLGYMRLGAYLRYIHFDAVSETRSIRLAQIVYRVVRGSARICGAVARDCDDLIGFDEGVT